MEISVSSLVYEINAAHRVRPVQWDLDRWNKIEFPESAQSYITASEEGAWVGLFGYDLDEWKSSC